MCHQQYEESRPQMTHGVLTSDPLVRRFSRLLNLRARFSQDRWMPSSSFASRPEKLLKLSRLPSTETQRRGPTRAGAYWAGSARKPISACPPESPANPESSGKQQFLCQGFGKPERIIPEKIQNSFDVLANWSRVATACFGEQRGFGPWRGIRICVRARLLPFPPHPARNESCRGRLAALPTIGLDSGPFP